MTTIVELNREPKDIPENDLNTSLQCYIRISYNGTYFLISKKYIENMKLKGWKGLEAIPKQCIVND